MKAELWPDLVGSVITVQVDIPNALDGDDTYYEITGKCVAADKVNGFALTVSGHTKLIKASNVLDVDVVPRRGNRITSRSIQRIDESGAQQHLIDRHGMAHEAVRALSASAAWQKHEEIVHASFGHQHNGTESDAEPVRWIEVVSDSEIIQHIISTHSVPPEFAERLEVDVAAKMHQMMAHDSLSHRHGRRQVSLRWLQEMDESTIRQHLLDRHGLPIAAVRAMSAPDAFRLHESTGHENLGHRHGEKPPSRPGRRKNERPIE